MVHLIWTKDNTSSSEDEYSKKSVKEHLIYCYKSLFMDVPDGTHSKDAAQIIAMRWIEYFKS